MLFEQLFYAVCRQLAIFLQFDEFSCLRKNRRFMQCVANVNNQVHLTKLTLQIYVFLMSQKRIDTSSGDFWAVCEGWAHGGKFVRK